MSAVLNHPVLPHRFLASPPPTPPRSATLSLLEAKRRFHPLLSPLISTSRNLPYRVATCLRSPSSSSSSSSPPPPPPRTRFNPATRLFVSGLSFRTSEDSLVNAFKKFGELVEVNLVMDKIANRPRGFAFLRYATEEESRKAIEGMHGKFLDGRVIFVEIAKSRAELRPDSNRTPDRSEY